MLVFTLLIFINSIFISVSDESEENKYIDSLPEKEKKEFLEIVARRILEEVKSSEAVPGLVSGEIPDEQLKVHSEYVSKVLKEETENLKRRKLTKEENKNDTHLNTGNVDPMVEKVDETEKKIEDIEKAIEKVHNVDVHNQTESKLRTEQENEKSHDEESKVIDLTLRKGKDMKPEVESEQVGDNSQKQETEHTKDSRRADKDENKAIDLTLRHSDPQISGKVQDEDELRLDNKNQTNVELTEKVVHENLKVSNNSSKESSTEKLPINETESTTEKKHIKEPISIEITVVDNVDYKDDSEKSKLDKKDEIPVQVIYDKNNKKELKETVQDISSTDKGYNTTVSTINDNHSQTEEPDTKKKILKTFRRNNEPGVDDNVEEIGQVADNQIARKKRKSNNTGSSEISTGPANAEVTHINDNQESGTEQVELSSNSNIASDNNINITPETTAVNVSNVTYNTSLVIENITNKDTETSEVKAETTTVETLQSTEDKLEQITDNIKNQYTQIQDFDANENETTSDPVTTSYTGTTTEEIIKIKTQFISGYPEDSYENSTVITEANDTQVENTTANPNDKFEKGTTEEVIHIKTEYITGYPDDYEKTTLKPEVNNTKIENATVSPDDKFKNSTTEEVIYIKTESITGYPDDYERTTLKSEVIDTEMKNKTVNSDDKFEQTSIEIFEPKGSQDMNASFYALKLSDKDIDGISGATNNNSIPAHGGVNIKIDVSLTQPKKNAEDLNDTKTAKLRELTHVLADFIKHNKKEKTAKSNLDKEKSETQNAKQQNLESQAPVSKDPVIEYITSTTIVPLTTPEINVKKELYYLQEPSAEILNDSIVILKDHIDSKEKLTKALRSDNNFVKVVRDEAKINIMRPAKKEYLVYEILPGQQQFVKKQPIKKLTKKLNPKEYPKLTKYVSNQVKPFDSEQISQIEQPNYAPVYNYAPEFAYFNPKNKYGLNFDDEEKIIVDDRSDNDNYAKEQPNYAPVYNYAPEFAYYNPHNKYGLNSDNEENKIVDERSNERDFADIGKIFDYEIPNYEKNEAKNRQGARSDRPLVINMQLNDKKPLKKKDRISEDYYFGFFDRTQDKEKNVLRNVGRYYPCGKKICSKPYVDVVQDPLVPPNSDEPHHAYNALLNRKPPVTHYTQVKSILGDLKYYHHDHHHIHNYKCKKNETYYHGDGETWIGPDLDLFYAKRIDKKRFLRSGGDEDKKGRKGDKRFRTKISDRSHAENKKHLLSLNNTFQMTDLHPLAKMSNKFKRRPMFLLTGALKPSSKQTEKKRPLFLLTGRHKGGTTDQKPQLLLLTGRLNSNEKVHDKKNTLLLLTGRLNRKSKSDQKMKIKKAVSDENEKYYIINERLSDERHDMNKRNKYPLPLFDYEFSDKKIARSKSSEEAELHYHDPEDISSAEPDTLKELNPKVVSLIIEMSENATDPRYQRKLLSKLKKQGKLYTPAKKPKKIEYEELLPQLKQQGLFVRSGDKNLEAYVNVMKDMIRKDSKALKQYDWLSTTVDIRSAFNKLSQLGQLLQDDTSNIHPKDLQIVKYMLYLFSTAQNLFEEDEKEVDIPVPSESEESPKNQRFTYVAKDSTENPKNLRFEYKDYKTINGRKRNGRRFEYRPWLRKDGVKERMVHLNKFLEQLEQTLDGLHDAIKHIAIVTNYRSQRWFENLRQLYITDPPSRKQALEVILHISLTRLISLIEESAANGLESNYVRYGVDNPEQVERTRDEFAFVVKVYLALKKLQ